MPTEQVDEVRAVSVENWLPKKVLSLQHFLWAGCFSRQKIVSGNKVELSWKISDRAAVDQMGQIY